MEKLYFLWYAVLGKTLLESMGAKMDKKKNTNMEVYIESCIQVPVCIPDMASVRKPDMAPGSERVYGSSEIY